MHIPFRRYLEEFILYSSQFLVLFCLMLFLVPSADSLRLVSLIIILFFLAIQLSLLVKDGHLPALRIVFSLITPSAYTLVRTVTGTFVPTDMANIFIWAAAIYVAIFQTMAVSAKVRWVKKTAEILLALGSVLVFVCFYFYLSLRLELAQQLATSTIDFERYIASLEISQFPPRISDFVAQIQNIFLILGMSFFGMMLLANKVIMLGLRARISTLIEKPETPTSAKKAVPPGGSEIMVTVVSSDIRDFTTLANKLGPELSVRVLNRYYALWANASEPRGGRVVSHVGDSVHVVFGLAGDKSTAENALLSCKSFLSELPSFKEDLVSASIPAIAEVSIGIHSGSIIAGDLGPPGGKNVGVFGDAISVASRLDSLCREFRQQVLLSQQVFTQLSLESQDEVIKIGEVLLRNSTHPVPVYTIK